MCGPRFTGTCVAAVLVLLMAAGAPAQEQVIAPGGNLVADGIPPIPASLAEDTRRYTETRAAIFAEWHPARREMLIATRFGNTPQIHHVKSPGGARTQMTCSSASPSAPRRSSRGRAGTSSSQGTSAGTSSDSCSDMT